jgi:hypothetical protein
LHALDHSRQYLCITDGYWQGIIQSVIVFIGVLEDWLELPSKPALGTKFAKLAELRIVRPTRAKRADAREATSMTGPECPERHYWLKFGNAPRESPSKSVPADTTIVTLTP